MKEIKMDECDIGDKRSEVDRRANRGFTLKSLFLCGNREEIRRQEDKGKIFLADRYSSTIFAAIVVILLLSVFDGVLTLILIPEFCTKYPCEINLGFNLISTDSSFYLL